MGKTFLVTDASGLFAEHANGLAKAGENRVLYFTPYNYHYRDFALGKDYGYLEKALYFFEHVEKADCIVNFDVRNEDLIGWLRDQFPDKSIFGSGWGCKIEDNRQALKDFTKALSLPMQGYVHLKGISALREHLKKNKDKFVKLNIFRGDMESFYSPDYDSVELKLDQIAEVFGPHKEDYEFIVEDAIDSDAEIGFDGFFNGTDYMKPYLIGYEYHKNLYVGKVTETLPPALEETMTAFKPVLSKLKYRAAISTEEKIVSQEKHYLLDFCARLASPFTAGYTEWIRNWPELIYSVGKGLSVPVDFKTKYVGAFTLKSQDALDVYVKVNIQDEEKVKMLMMCGNPKGAYAVKGEDHVAVVIAGGDTVEEVIEQLHKNAEAVDADGLNKDPMDGIEAIYDVIEAGEDVGIEF